MIELQKIKSIYFIGIGGSGMSSIAHMMLVKGKKVFGSDRERTSVTQELEASGAKIFYEQNGKNIPSNIDLVIYTVAIPDHNKDYQKAKEIGVQMLTYPQTLGLLSKNMVTIAVAGTHGKTTTTAMLSHVLRNTKIEPTVIIGAVPVDQKTNFIEGKGEYLLIEADEYRKSFLNLNPKYLIITNIDEDHLDFYKDLKDIQNTFVDLVSKIPQDGLLVCDKTNPHLKPVIKSAKCVVVDYKNSLSKDIALILPGEHNRKNASAVVALVKHLGLKDKAVYEKIISFKGVRRRFEFSGKTVHGAHIYDDYAHNPQKVGAALQGAREFFPNQRIIAVFQPHLYSRTKTLLKLFGKSFINADRVILAPIYAAREEFDKTISSEILAKEIEKNNKTAEALFSVSEIEKKLNKILKKDDIVVILGAGDITNLSKKLVTSK